MKPPGIAPGGLRFPVLKRRKNGRVLSDFGHYDHTCNDSGRTMHVGGSEGTGAPIPGESGGRCANPWGLGDTMTERRRRGRLARPARGDPRRHRGHCEGSWTPVALSAPSFSTKHQSSIFAIDSFSGQKSTPLLAAAPIGHTMDTLPVPRPSIRTNTMTRVLNR